MPSSGAVTGASLWRHVARRACAHLAAAEVLRDRAVAEAPDAAARSVASDDEDILAAREERHEIAVRLEVDLPQQFARARAAREQCPLIAGDPEARQGDDVAEVSVDAAGHRVPLPIDPHDHRAAVADRDNVRSRGAGDRAKRLRLTGAVGIPAAIVEP